MFFFWFFIVVPMLGNMPSSEEGQILRPLAVIPLNDGNAEEISTLENFAATSNSQMIYACNELGEKVAVGLFVTENFNVTCPDTNDLALQESFQLPSQSTGNDAWVGAEEECVTEIGKEVVNEAKPDNKTDVICLYKVNKGTKKETRKKNVGVKRMKTLQEIKNTVKKGRVHG